MGFFDTVRDKAGALATDAGRAGRVTAAQARLVVLQNDLRKAERELGHAAFALAERGELDHPDLAHAVERLRATAAEVSAKEAEIAALRDEPLTPATVSGETPAPAATVVAATVQTVAGPVTVAPAQPEPAVAATPPAPEAAPEAPAAAPTEEGALPEPETAVAGAAAKPARRRAAVKPPIPVAKKAPAKKAPPASKAAAKKTASRAGATPKKSSRPRSGPRPAGKNHPAGT